jgi:hypothetical protein
MLEHEPAGVTPLTAGEEPAPVGQPSFARQPPAINIELLADKVYDLMRAEIEVSIMRGERAPDRRRDRY